MNLQENIIRIKEVMGIYTSDQNIIVEASKKEILIDKLGFSNENAEVLANAAGPFSVWLGNKLINDGAFEYSKEYLNKVGIMNHVLSKITSIMDWIRVGLNGNAKPYQNMFFEQLYELSKEWHDSLKFGEGDFNYKEKNKILQDYRDENGIGFYWVDLGTNSSDEECNRMGHCGETALGNSLYSLRSTQRFTKDFTLNKSYLTVAVGEKDGLIYQIKGPKNSKPNKKYHPYIVDLILNNDHIQGFGRGSIVYDFRITDLPKQEIVKMYLKKPELFNTNELKNYLKNELSGENPNPNDVSVENKSQQENIHRIKEVMGIVIETRQGLLNYLKEGLLDTSWENEEGDKVTLMDLLNATEDIPVSKVDLEVLKPHLLTWDGDEEERVKIDKADLQYPILIFVEDDGSFISIIDGHHRAQKAVKNKLETIKAKVISINSLPKNIRKVFSHMGKQEQNESELTERCWKGYTQKGMKTMFGKRYPNCVKKTK